MLLSKATYNWGIHEAINLKETNRERKGSQYQVSGIVQFIYLFFKFRMSSSVERDEFSVVA